MLSTSALLSLFLLFVYTTHSCSSSILPYHSLQSHFTEVWFLLNHSITMWRSSYNVSPRTEVLYLKPFIAIVHITHTHMHRCTCNLSQLYAVGGYVIVWYFYIHVLVSTSTLCVCVPHIQRVCTHKFILGVQFHSVNSLCVHVCESTSAYICLLVCAYTHSIRMHMYDMYPHTGVF